MAGAFEIATKQAIEDIIEAHAQKSKFGYILTNESFRNLADDFYQLLMNSRNLKAAGDRILPPQPGQTPQPTPTIGPSGRGRFIK